MCDNFIYGTKLSFAELIDRMKELQERFRKIKEGLHIHLYSIHLKYTAPKKQFGLSARIV